jgi:hypothetical protein
MHLKTLGVTGLGDIFRDIRNPVTLGPRSKVGRNALNLRCRGRKDKKTKMIGLSSLIFVLGITSLSVNEMFVIVS